MDFEGEDDEERDEEEQVRIVTESRPFAHILISLAERHERVAGI